MKNSTLLYVIVALMVLASTALADDTKMQESPDTATATVSTETAVDSTERINLIGDVLALFIVAVVLAILMPRGEKSAA